MQLSRERRLAVGSSALAAAALVFALAAEWGGGLVPCALCLLERWPYWIAIGLGALAFLLPRRGARLALITLALVVLSGTAMAIVHVGVEQRWWPSPLPECAAPRLTGGSVAERMANMPARPAKPCDDPTYVDSRAAGLDGCGEWRVRPGIRRRAAHVAA